MLRDSSHTWILIESVSLFVSFFLSYRQMSAILASYSRALVVGLFVTG